MSLEIRLMTTFIPPGAFVDQSTGRNKKCQNRYLELWEEMKFHFEIVRPKEICLNIATQVINIVIPYTCR